MKPCSIIRAPSGLGLSRAGVSELPDALLDAGLLEGLPDVRDCGTVPVPSSPPRIDQATGVLNAGAIGAFALRLAERVRFTLELGRFPLVLGGDCSILLGPMLALRRRGRYGLFFLDGHADFYSPESEQTGEAASMDLALVTGHGPAPLVDLAGRRPLVHEEDAVAFAIRDGAIAQAEGSPDVRSTAVNVIDLDEVRRLGASAAARRGLARLEARPVDGFWIHLDADVLSDDVMPAVDYRVPGGLTPAELTDSLAVILASPLAVGMEVTIYNPTLDDEERTAARVLAEAVTLAFADAGRSAG